MNEDRNFARLTNSGILVCLRIDVTDTRDLGLVEGVTDTRDLHLVESVEDQGSIVTREEMTEDRALQIVAQFTEIESLVYRDAVSVQSHSSVIADCQAMTDDISPQVLMVSALANFCLPRIGQGPQSDHLARTIVLIVEGAHPINTDLVNLLLQLFSHLYDLQWCQHQWPTYKLRSRQILPSQPIEIGRRWQQDGLRSIQAQELRLRPFEFHLPIKPQRLSVRSLHLCNLRFDGLHQNVQLKCGREHRG